MSFEKKKIQLETLGEYLREVRLSLSLTEERAAAGAGIKLRFLRDLESGEFQRLPPDVYVRGFLRQLAEFYAVEPGPLVEQYGKEKIIQSQILQTHNPGKNRLKKVFGGIAVTPGLISAALGLLFVFVTLLYIIWQVGAISRQPALEIYEPRDRQVITDSFVRVNGKTDPGSSVDINGQDVFVNGDGSFSVQLAMEAGPKLLQVMSKNKFDKISRTELSVVGQERSDQSGLEVVLRLEFTGIATISYSLDEGSWQTLEFAKGDVKTLSARQKILITTSDAGATVAAINGQVVGPLGRPGERLERIPFSSQSASINQ